MWIKAVYTPTGEMVGVAGWVLPGTSVTFLPFFFF
jgi:Flp pilus assembly protein CpaB